MELFHAGTLIKELRKKRGWTQDFLCHGICSKGSLSRIERNEHSPELFIYSSLMERLGEDPYRYYTGLITMDDKKIMDFHEKLKQLLRQKTDGANAEAEELIQELEEEDTYKSKKFSQLMLHHKATLAFNRKEYDKSYSFALDGLKLTKPKFNVDTAENDIYTAVEVELVNTLAGILLSVNKLEESEKIYSALYTSLETNYRTDVSKRKPSLQILYNLTTNLGLLSKYVECYPLCDKGIELSKEERNYNYLSLFIYNKACCLLYLNRRDEGISVMSRAYALYFGIHSSQSIINMKHLLDKDFNISISDIYESLAPQYVTAKQGKVN